jgi:hypothetical protein
MLKEITDRATIGAPAPSRGPAHEGELLCETKPSLDK